MHITRRHLLALSAGTAAVGAIGAGGLGISWWNQPAQHPYRTLTLEEAGFVRSWAEVAFPATPNIPLGGRDAKLDRFFDEMLMASPDDTRKLLKVLLHALDTLSVVTDAHRFQALDIDQQHRLFHSWSNSDNSMFRSAVQSLTMLMGMGWSTHPEVAPFMQKLHSCGYGR